MGRSTPVTLPLLKITHRDFRPSFCQSTRCVLCCFSFKLRNVRIKIYGSVPCTMPAVEIQPCHVSPTCKDSSLPGIAHLGCERRQQCGLCRSDSSGSRWLSHSVEEAGWHPPKFPTECPVGAWVTAVQSVTSCASPFHPPPARSPGSQAESVSRK